MRTPSQTVGPFFSIGLTRQPQHELPGGDVRLTGRVTDGEGEPVVDAVVEVWDPGSRAQAARARTHGVGPRLPRPR